MGWLNIGSLFLGLYAWLLPAISLLNYPDECYKQRVNRAMYSFSACAVALVFQIIYTGYLVTIKDWVALMDTTGVVAYATITLVMVTMLLNIVVFVVYRKRTEF
ncbi:hypothetical protein [Lysinibacillus piscis]|uniref:Uncharacterized protein n=1 Tax=Lysinibacillus piscis TaxID=2518931 RepID=A0ABQ5NNC6_9BACI|nr:hypothetical protein [Lysinibacillus sp. KH24]GLC89613.1 hypothetical protein LYSBPC_27400 [Lysinibacillus sp. KH24]